MDILIQDVITGIATGMVYALIALGFALIWKSSRVANLALGQLVLISSWFTYSMLVQLEFPFWLGMILTVVFAIVLGWLIERLALRPLIGQPILSLIAITLGLAYFLEGFTAFIWPQGQGNLPKVFPQASIRIGPAMIQQELLWAAVISLALFILLSVFFKYHRMGIAMRATADDQLAVQACAVPVTRVFSMSWIFACIVAAIGGVLISSIAAINYGLVETGFKSFSVVILGGMESFLGCIVAGPIIGLCETFGGSQFGSSVKELIPFIIIVIVIMIKPFGLFGEERIERI
ncbi:MAG: branched-chain amino acid ABC transporter permease [Dehalococcoidia bacterium]